MTKTSEVNECHSPEAYWRDIQQIIYADCAGTLLHLGCAPCCVAGALSDGGAICHGVLTTQLGHQGLTHNVLGSCRAHDAGSRRYVSHRQSDSGAARAAGVCADLQGSPYPRIV
jgi:hypothetical protein